MAEFPPYDGPPLPKALNPLNPFHYVLLLDWIYLKPSRLRHYLHRVDPDLYFERSWPAFKRVVRLPVYRNVMVMSLILAGVFSVILAWGASLFQGVPVNGWLLFVMLVGLEICALFVVTQLSWGVGVLVALHAALSVTMGVIAGSSWGLAVVAVQQDAKVSAILIFVIAIFGVLSAVMGRVVKGKARPPSVYDGPPLPKALNPLNPRHYWLLLKWRWDHAAYTHYMDQAAPDADIGKGWPALKYVLRSPALRNLFLMWAIGTAVFTFAIFWIPPGFQDTLLAWTMRVCGLVLGAFGGVFVLVMMAALSFVLPLNALSKEKADPQSLEADN